MRRLIARMIVALCGFGALVATLSLSADPANPASPPVVIASADSGREALIQAEHFLSLGDRARAVEILTTAMPGIDRSDSPRTQAVACALLGRAHLQLAQFDAAAPLIERALELSISTAIPELVPSVLNDRGLLHVATHDDDLALAEYTRALAAAKAAHLPALAARIRINHADLHLRRSETAAAQALLDATLKALDELAASPEKGLIATSAASRLLSLQTGVPNALVGATLGDALRDAIEASDLRGQSEAYGELGRVHQRAGRYDAAIAHTRKAMFAAQAAQAPELLYRWEWQAARMMAAQDKPDEAIAFYGRAMATLQPIRHDLLQDLRATGSSYRDHIGPLFLEYADLLLKQSARVTEPASIQNNLLAARETIEQMKTVQLEDYFQDDCVAQFEARRRDIDRLEPGTAVIYPIILKDRLELLLSVGDRLRRISVEVAGKTLSDEARRFRKLLVKRDTEQYLPIARQLHSWLIQPLLETLKENRIDTLVVVPDGALLGIPFAALHDGQDFLIQHFAIATAPALHLVEPNATTNIAERALLGGLSESVQGFPALPSVDSELGELGQLYDAQRLDNQQFTVPRVEQAVDRNLFSVVHIASHGKFEADARKSFLLTYDGRMGMDSLERIVKSGRFREDPVDLLTLSACETAAGDERAALGLAGVAIKAGARSVVATLWFIDDEASSALIRTFYRELGKGKLSKALQAAQLSMLAEPRYLHPGYWAPLLVIGNWT